MGLKATQQAGATVFTWGYDGWGSARRECLDHVIILSESHLKAVLAQWVAHFNRGRPHQGLKQRVPVPSDASSGASAGKVIALPVLGGLHHEYRRVA